MDIDLTRRTKNLPLTCRRCGKAGHKAKDCDQLFDVRNLDTSEIDSLQLLLDAQRRLLLAQHEVNALAPEAEESLEPTEAMEASRTEDFPASEE